MMPFTANELWVIYEALQSVNYPSKPVDMPALRGKVNQAWARQVRRQYHNGDVEPTATATTDTTDKEGSE